MRTHVIKDLEQAKLLTDPFKLKIIEQFFDGPVTTKQVADRLNEKAPRLYRHVDALVEAGFLELVEERQKRGTVERYYKTIASRFEVDPEIFETHPDAAQDGMSKVVRNLFRESQTELMRLKELDPSAADPDMPLPLVARASVQASPAQIAKLRAFLEDWLQQCQAFAEDGVESAPGDLTYGGLIAFYPLVEELKESEEREDQEKP